MSRKRCQWTWRFASQCPRLALLRIQAQRGRTGTVLRAAGLEVVVKAVILGGVVHGLVFASSRAAPEGSAIKEVGFGRVDHILVCDNGRDRRIFVILMPLHQTGTRQKNLDLFLMEDSQGAIIVGIPAIDPVRLS
ncbi:hypothetical protein QBC34DRAFT_499700 [Podospora aff. communis PSN243]|uniref:Uncharacterized protein n=1 Tax=Podospora aff. communis PSN243 TaxID=3040156 RepID=A0AAV9G287_9PEZI|nr:hypothetical protein QBC34DRAFT_499700 [Podospora aff. communis PSN243]